MIRIKRQKRASLPPGLVPRVDPRQREAEAALAALERSSSAAAAPIRRNPHEEKCHRLRRELRLARKPSRIVGLEPAARVPKRIVVPDDVPWVVAVSLPEEAWSDAEREVLGVARELADRRKGGVVLVRIGGKSAAEDVGALGVDRLVHLPFDADPDTVAQDVAMTADHFSAVHLLFAEGGADADLSRRTALLLDDRPATALQVLPDADRVVVPQAGGRFEASRAVPKVMTLSQGRFDPISGGALREGRQVAFAPEAGPSFVRDLGMVATSQLDAPLDEARFIISAGDGVTDWAAFRAVAKALGGTIAGSRQVCDAGHLPRDRQVGASGTLVEARCYLAFGISGAPQHLQGVQRCRYVIAVNTDFHAAMIKRADLAIVADAQKVMPELARLARGHVDA